MLIEAFACVFDLTFQFVSIILPALEYIYQQILYLISSWLLPTLCWIITQSISFVLSWMLPALSWILEQAIDIFWHYPVVIKTKLNIAILLTVASPCILYAMGFRSAGILANSFGAWLMSVVYAAGRGLRLLAYFQSAGARGKFIVFFGVIGGTIGCGLSYIYSLLFS